MKVLMLIIAWIAQGDQIHEAWRVERVVSAETCAAMQKVGNQGGKYGVITVRCDPIGVK